MKCRNCGADFDKRSAGRSAVQSICSGCLAIELANRTDSLMVVDRELYLAARGVWEAAVPGNKAGTSVIAWATLRRLGDALAS